MQYLHAAAFSPVTSTWLKAIERGFFQSWPVLNAKTVRNYLPKSPATSKGYLDQTRKNARSTNPKTDDEDDDEPTPEPNNNETELVFATIEAIGKVYTDQTERFPVTSSRGTKYICVLYAYDTKAILTEPLKDHSGKEIV